jgi:ribosome-dependent ATPase
MSDLHSQFWPLLLSVPVIIGVAIILLKKQDQ